MKHMYGMCALALFATATLFVGTQANFAQADEESNSATKVTFSVPGMKWGGCPAKVRAALEPLDGVTEVEIDFPGRLATVEVNDSFDLEGAIEALEEAGYPATVSNES